LPSPAARWPLALEHVAGNIFNGDIRLDRKCAHDLSAALSNFV
jgi:hypothetical protein